MKIRVERDALSDAVAWVVRSLPARSTAPILTGLLISAEGDQARLSSFDSTTSAKVTMAADVSEEGTVLVSGRLLAEIARSLPNKPVEMTSDRTRVELVCGSARFTLQTLPVDEYPELPELPEEVGQVDADALEKAVAQVVVAAGRNERLDVFTAVRMEINGDQLSLLATDRYRMALKELSWNPTTPDAEEVVLVPAKVLSDTARALSASEKVGLSLSNTESDGGGLLGLVGERDGDSREATTRLVSQTFPKVRHLMDLTPTVSVRISTDELTAAVKRVALVAERHTALSMIIKPDHIALEAATGDQAQASEALNAEVDIVGEQSIEVANFNPSYLLDALGAFDTPFVHFSFTEPAKRCLITGLPSIDGEQQFDYRHVIMLMR